MESFHKTNGPNIKCKLLAGAIIKSPEFFEDYMVTGEAALKISSGWSKGLKILTPEGLDTRPTRERVRQAAINMLQPWIPGARVLDLFAGSGAVGLELVSRGSAGAHFVETSPAALKCLKSNMSDAKSRAEKQTIKIDPWQLSSQDAFKFIENPVADSFDLIWADPPYELVPQFLKACEATVPIWLAAGGVFVLESGVGAKETIDSWSSSCGLELVKQREYGVTLISIWQRAQ